MASQGQIGARAIDGRNRKGKIRAGIFIFILGVIAGVVGLCVALKFIFYIGLAVALIAAVALVWGIMSVKSRLSSDEGDRYRT